MMRQRGTKVQAAAATAEEASIDTAAAQHSSSWSRAEISRGDEELAQLAALLSE